MSFDIILEFDGLTLLLLSIAALSNFFDTWCYRRGWGHVDGCSISVDYWCQACCTSDECSHAYQSQLQGIDQFSQPRPVGLSAGQSLLFAFSDFSQCFLREVFR